MILSSGAGHPDDRRGFSTNAALIVEILRPVWHLCKEKRASPGRERRSEKSAYFHSDMEFGSQSLNSWPQNTCILA
jgi:hypothetical protein